MMMVLPSAAVLQNGHHLDARPGSSRCRFVQEQQLRSWISTRASRAVVACPAHAPMRAPFFSVSPTSSSTSFTVFSAGRRNLVAAPKKSRYSVTSIPYTRRRSPHVPITWRTASASRSRSRPRICAVPADGARNVARMRRWCLAAPFDPMKPNKSPLYGKVESIRAVCCRKGALIRTFERRNRGAELFDICASSPKSKVQSPKSSCVIDTCATQF